MGLFRAVLGEGSARVRYLSDAPYRLYLMHLPLIIALQGATQDLGVALGGQAGAAGDRIICGAAASLRVGLRYTPVGTLLNGRRVRAWRAEV